MKRSIKSVALLSLAGLSLALGAVRARGFGERQILNGDWHMQSSVLVTEGGPVISNVGYGSNGWRRATVPTTVLNALVRQGVYPDVRFGLNSFRVPDASDEFNQNEKLSQYSHLPGQRNPWTDPWWFRRTFELPPITSGERTWLHLDSINYRAEVWLNGHKVAGPEEVVSMNQRFTFDVSQWARAGSNCLAVKVWRVDHVGSPGTQLTPLVNNRFEDHVSDGPMDYAVQLAGGYDCFPSIPDRYTGILQDVWMERSGSVTIRDPFVATELPLPRTDRAKLSISATLVNGSTEGISGVLRASVTETGVVSETPVTLRPGETKQASMDPAPVLEHPMLWWPNGYGAQSQYELNLEFLAGGTVSHRQKVRFGVRQITCEMHEHNGHYGRRILINGQRIFARGGYIQPDALMDWTPERMDREIRYYAEANLNLIYFEDIANPPAFFFEACDRYGVMVGQCFYGCSWMQTGSKYPADVPLVIQCSRDIIKRYRNHPSLVMYMASNEGFTREEVYGPWRASVIELDGTRFWVPSNGMPNTTPDKVQPWFRDDMPTGMTDLGGNTYGWEERAEYYRRVRENPNWMFMAEVGSASLPPLSSLAKFIPNLGQAPKGPTFPLDATWAHHGANVYFKPYDAAVRRVYGEPTTVGDYVWQGHLATADQHRAMFEAVNHRLWDVTSGLTEWKLNSAWPDVQWQIFDWFLKPMVSYYFIKRANEPVHIQLGLIEPTVTVVNHSLHSQNGLKARARVLDLSMQLLYDHEASIDAAANAFRDAFELPKLTNLPPVYFVRLDLRDAAGQRVSDNFYWFTASKDDSFSALRSLSPVKLATTWEVQNRGAEQIAKVTISNPSDHLAFFVQLAITRDGDEILPVLWEDNYISLLPGESRAITARFASPVSATEGPKLEVGGWNIENEVQCEALQISRTALKPRDSCEVTAMVRDTFLDGSRVYLRWDGTPICSAVAFARKGSSEQIIFSTTADRPGIHQLSVGTKQIEIRVEP